jgi:hypothetical protein
MMASVFGHGIADQSGRWPPLRSGDGFQAEGGIDGVDRSGLNPRGRFLAITDVFCQLRNGKVRLRSSEVRFFQGLADEP